MQKIKLKFETGLRAYYHLQKILPPERLSFEQEKYKKNLSNNLDFHPFIKLLNDAKTDLDGKKITNNIARLILLELDIELLCSKNIQGINEKISEIITSGYQKADSLIYEIRIAGHLTKQGHDVKFIEESKTQKRPDLLIDNKIELDCKNKDPAKLDLFNYDYFVKKWDIIMTQLTSEQKFVFVYVLFNRTDRIEEELGESAKSKVLELISSGITGKTECNGFEIFIYPICSDNQDVINTNLPYLDKTEINLLKIHDVVDSALRQRLGDVVYHKIMRQGISYFVFRNGIRNLNGKTGLSEFHALCCTTKKLPERFTPMLDAIRVANNQMSEKFAGIVCIGISDLMAKMFPMDFQQAGILINNVLPSNPNISAALLTAEEFDEDSGEYSFGVQIIRNNSAKIKLPVEYDKLANL